ncbi:penicillin-binding protein 1A [Steroidobacter denitrificans]|uniref:Penicillin-binding protein 1A n=1 Tax=Steroidobacter denitrificans TaxID=465721 RepID=A0A127FCY8_STEDE|nr:penicillin-binding protein 1A [Steroidobacter denitrificans]
MGAILLALVGAAALALLGAYQYLHPALPDVSAIKDIRLREPLRVYSRDGRLIAQFGEERRIPLTYTAIPRQMVNAVLAAEDDDFFEHGGVDYPGLARATLRHLISGNKAEGGSTITMQLARGIFLSPEKSYRRKLLEIFTTLRIEQELDKEEILALYLNKMFLGQRAYGIGAAAEVYFGKTVDRLTLPEIALIAGTFRLPSRDNPVASPALAKQRRAYVLRRMREKGFITQDEHDIAVNAPVKSHLHGPAVQVEAPYVAEMVRADLLERLGPEIYTAGYKAIATIDSRLQGAAVRALRGALVEYDQRHGYRGPAGRTALEADADEKQWSQALNEYSRPGGLEPALILSVEERSAVAWTRVHGRLALAWSGISWARTPRADGSVGPVLRRAGDVLAPGDIVYMIQERSDTWRLAQLPEAQGAFVAVDPRDGAVAALVGGFDYYISNYNRAVQARRQPGSAFKPFIYSAALDHGFTPASLINDAPLVIEDAAMEGSWRPQNVTRQFHGPTRLREALVRSRNLVSIRIMNALGPAYATKFIERFGFTQASMPHNLTLALGTAQVSPLEMARAYSVFANGGFRVEPYHLQRIIGPDDAVIYEAQPRYVCAECMPMPEIEALRPGLYLDMADGSPWNTPEAPQPGVPVGLGQTNSSSYLQPEQLAEAAISPQNAFLMTDMMADVIRRGTGVRARQLNRRDLAGKTGTTNDRRDAWFCGFNSALVGAAWVGFDQERSLGPGEEGGRTALPMWIYFMADALEGLPEQKREIPPELVSMRISADTGLAARPGEPNAIFETFMTGHLPAEAAYDSALPDLNGNADEEQKEESLF